MPSAPWALVPGSLYYTTVTRERESGTTLATLSS